MQADWRYAEKSSLDPLPLSLALSLIIYSLAMHSLLCSFQSIPFTSMKLFYQPHQSPPCFPIQWFLFILYLTLPPSRVWQIDILVETFPSVGFHGILFCWFSSPLWLLFSFSGWLLFLYQDSKTLSLLPVSISPLFYLGQFRPMLLNTIGKLKSPNLHFLVLRSILVCLTALSIFPLKSLISLWNLHTKQDSWLSIQVSSTVPQVYKPIVWKSILFPLSPTISLPAEYSFLHSP